MLQNIIVYDTGFHVVQSEKGFRTCILLIPVDVAKFDTCKKPRSVSACIFAQSLLACSSWKYFRSIAKVFLEVEPRQLCP